MLLKRLLATCFTHFKPEKLKKRVIKLSFDTNFRLIGISTRLSAHKLSWLLNAQIDTRFKQIDDLVLTSNQNENNLAFAVYEFEAKSDLIYKLIENKKSSGILIKKLNIDYLLKIEGSFSEKTIDQLVKKIRKTESINACLLIDNKNIKQKDIDLLA